MKAEKIYFERTKSLPGYNNVKVGIELLIEYGEKASDVLQKAKVFVANALNEVPTSEQMELTLHMVSTKKEIEELPF